MANNLIPEELNALILRNGYQAGLQMNYLEFRQRMYPMGSFSIRRVQLV
jgi:hypothetical protein